MQKSVMQMKARKIAAALLMLAAAVCTGCKDDEKTQFYEADLDTAIAAVRNYLNRQNLAALDKDLTLYTEHPATEVSITWVSSDPAHLTSDGKITRPEFGEGNAVVILTGTFTKGTGSQLSVKKEEFTVIVLQKPNPDQPYIDAVASKIRKAEVALGDLSTVDANISLPATDASVTVSWSTSDSGVVSNTGVITRGSAHGTATLTGTFTSVSKPTITDTKTWPVRVMRNNATWDEYLNVHYKVDADGVFKNVAWSGDYYKPALKGNASIGVVEFYRFVNVGSNGYIDLGPKVGALLRKPNFYVEFYIRIPSDTGTMLSFANDENINNTNSTNTNSISWRGTILLSNSGLYFRALNAGANGITNDEGSATAGATTGNSLGIGNRVNQWLNIGLMKTGNNINIMRNWSRAQNTPGVDISRITSNSAFGSGSEELDPLRFAYLGRSVLVNSGYIGTGAAATITRGTPNAYYYEIKIYSKNFTLANTIEHPQMAANRTAKKTMNDNCGYANTD